MERTLEMSNLALSGSTEVSCLRMAEVTLHTLQGSVGLLIPAAWRGWAQCGARRVTLLGAGQGAREEWSEENRAEVRKTLRG